jgi:hypothetical protein
MADSGYAFIFDDEGKTWKWKNTLENNPDKRARYSYPSLIQTADGLLHISYSYQTKNPANRSSMWLLIQKQFTDANTEIAKWIKRKEWANGLTLTFSSKIQTFGAVYRQIKTWDAAFTFKNAKS